MRHEVSTYEASAYGKMNITHEPSTSTLITTTIPGSRGFKSFVDKGTQTSPDDYDNLISQIKEENDALKHSIKNLNRRIGDEIIADEDSEQSDNGDEMMSPIHTHDPFVDHQFAKQYIYMTNVSMAWTFHCRIIRTMIYTIFSSSLLSQSQGDRMYGENNHIVLKVDVLETLKKMNQSFPKNQPCYDRQFIYRVMKAIFKKKEVAKCAKSRKLRDLDYPKRHFLKGECNLLMGKMETIS